MKLKIVVFVLFAFNLSRAFGSCSHWKKRMEKYSSLVNCEYYVSSEGEYKEFFAFDELAKRTDSNTLQIRFFTLAPNILKFVLSEKNNSDSFNARELVRHEPDFNPMGPSDIYSDRIPTIKPELNSDLGENYEFVFGEISQAFNYHESYVKKGSNRLKTLITPGIIRNNEPNEVLIDIFPDGKIQATINENDRLALRGYNFDAIKYISFVSPNEGILTEFFYNCKN